MVVGGIIWLAVLVVGHYRGVVLSKPGSKWTMTDVKVDAAVHHSRMLKVIYDLFNPSRLPIDDVDEAKQGCPSSRQTSYHLRGVDGRATALDKGGWSQVATDAASVL